MTITMEEVRQIEDLMSQYVDVCLQRTEGDKASLEEQLRQHNINPTLVLPFNSLLWVPAEQAGAVSE